MTYILKSADRRLDVVRLQAHFKDGEQNSVIRVASVRRALRHDSINVN